VHDAVAICGKKYCVEEQKDIKRGYINDTSK